MAQREGYFSVRGQLYNMDAATGYSSGQGRVTLGRVSSLESVEFAPEVELLDAQEVGGHFERARLLGVNVTLELTLVDYSDELMSLIFSKLIPSGYALNFHGGLGQTSHYWGQDLPTTELAIIDEDSTRPALYIPKGGMVGPTRIELGQSQGMLQTAKLTILAFMDKTLGTPIYFGDVAGFPSLS